MDGEAEVLQTVHPSPFGPLREQDAVMVGLDKYQDYYITVLCFTSVGDGINSQPVFVKTLQDGKSKW